MSPELGLVAELARHREGLVVGQLEQVGTLVQHLVARSAMYAPG